MFGAIVFAVFASVMAIVLEAALLSVVIGSAAKRPVGISRTGPMVVVAFMFDTLMQVGMSFVPYNVLPIFPVSMVIWTFVIMFFGKLRLGESAMAAVVLAIANKIMIMLLFHNFATLYFAP